MNFKKIAVVASTAMLALSFGSGALAASDSPTVSQQINGGEFTASLGNGSLSAIDFDYTKSAATESTGSVTLTVDDARGTREGWSVSIQSGAFVYDGVATGDHDIVAENLSVTPGAPEMLAGESVVNVSAGTTGSLDSSRTVLSAPVGSGSGKYQQNLALTLAVPAYSPTGSYTATITVGTNAAPGT